MATTPETFVDALNSAFGKMTLSQLILAVTSDNTW